AQFAHFDKNGKYLYFLASTNLGLTTGWLDMSSDDHTTTRNVYLAVLVKTEASPLAPESDEEKAEEAKKPAGQEAERAEKPEDKKPAGQEVKKGEPVKVTIDFDGIDQRIIALPIPARNYGGMDVGKTGVVFVREVV